MVATKPLLREPLVLLKMFGVNPAHHTVWNCFKCALVLIPFYAMFLETFLYSVLKSKAVDSMFDLAMFGTFCQISAKVNAVAFGRQKIAKMLDVLNLFWQVNASNDKIYNIYRSVTRGYRIILFLAIISIILNYGLCIMFRSFPINMYYPSTPLETPFYELSMIFQIYILSITAGYFGSEYLFFACITYIVCEFKLIKERVLQLPLKFDAHGNSKQLMQELVSIIDQQNLVFEFVKMFNSFYSTVILTMFCTCIFIFSASLSSIVIKSSADGEFFMVLFLLMHFLMMLFGYCWAGNAVMTSSEDVLNGIVEADVWLVQEPKFKKALILVILRTQKLAKIRAGGMFDLNLETFTKIVNSAFSFFSLFRATYGKHGRN